MPPSATVLTPASSIPYTPFAAALLAVLTSCGAADQLATQAPQSLPPAFNVPALRGKTIDQVKAVLGAPENTDDEPFPDLLAAGQTKWAKSFAHDTIHLVVTYDAITRQVSNFVLYTQHELTADYGPLLRLANVHGPGSGLRVEPVPAPGTPGLFIGVQFWPQ